MEVTNKHDNVVKIFVSTHEAGDLVSKTGIIVDQKGDGGLPS